MMRRAVLLLALLAAPAGAQVTVPPRMAVADLPTCNAARGTRLIGVTDGASATDCTTGAGSTYVLCQCNGTTWVANQTGTGAATLGVQEEDGTPTVAGVTEIRVSNGTLTDNTGGSVSIATGGGGGSSVVLDLADDGTNESTGITEIATVGDVNSVATEPSADKLLLDFAKLAQLGGQAGGQTLSGTTTTGNLVLQQAVGTGASLQLTSGATTLAAAGSGNLILEGDGTFVVRDLDTIATSDAAWGFEWGDSKRIWTLAATYEDPTASAELIDWTLSTRMFGSNRTALQYNAIAGGTADLWLGRDATTHTKIGFDGAGGKLSFHSVIQPASGDRVMTFEGPTEDGFETEVSVKDPTGDRVFVIPDADSIAVQPTTCTGTDKVSAIAATTGAVTCSADQGGGLTIQEDDGTPSVASATTLKFDQADGFVLTDQGAGVVKVDFTGTGGSSNSFETWSAPAGTSPVADGANDTMTLAATAPVTITGDAVADSLTFAVSDATTGAKGVVQLAGDLAGTATVPVIGADKILESHLKAVDAPADEECLTYEATGGDFEWQPCGGGGGDGDNSEQGADYDPDREPADPGSGGWAEEWHADTASETWAWGDQGSATETLELDAAKLTCPQDAASAYRCRCKAAPAGSWTLTSKIHVNQGGSNTTGLGVILAGSIASPTDLDFWVAEEASSFLRGVRHSATSYTTAAFIANYTWNIPVLAQVPMMLQVRYDATADTLAFLSGGENSKVFRAAQTESSVTSDPVAVCYCCRNPNVANSAVVYFDWFRLRTDAGRNNPGS